MSPNYAYMYGLKCYLIDAFSNLKSFLSVSWYTALTFSRNVLLLCRKANYLKRVSRGFTALVKNSRLENAFTLYIALHQLKMTERRKFVTTSGSSVALWF